MVGKTGYTLEQALIKPIPTVLSLIEQCVFEVELSVP
jgi:hypothetical protein